MNAIETGAGVTLLLFISVPAWDCLQIHSDILMELCELW